MYMKFTCSCGGPGIVMMMTSEQHIGVLARMMFPRCPMCNNIMKESRSYRYHPLGSALVDPQDLSWVSYALDFEFEE